MHRYKNRKTEEKKWTQDSLARSESSTCLKRQVLLFIRGDDTMGYQESLMYIQPQEQVGQIVKEYLMARQQDPNGCFLADIPAAVRLQAPLKGCPKQYGTRRAAFQRGLQPDRGGNVRQEAPAGGLLPRHKILFYDLPNLFLRLDVYKAFLITHCVTSSPTNRFIPSDALFGTPRSGV